ncbi:hypothetical protein F385_1487 [Pantoea agglomerans 299R]|nr:hypothetical protein F385_1487 [Pantoea agglomerans 299R]
MLYRILFVMAAGSLWLIVNMVALNRERSLCFIGRIISSFNLSGDKNAGLARLNGQQADG